MATELKKGFLAHCTVVSHLFRAHNDHITHINCAQCNASQYHNPVGRAFDRHVTKLAKLAGWGWPVMALMVTCTSPFYMESTATLPPLPQVCLIGNKCQSSAWMNSMSTRIAPVQSFRTVDEKRSLRAISVVCAEPWNDRIQRLLSTKAFS